MLEAQEINSKYSINLTMNAEEALFLKRLVQNANSLAETVLEANYRENFFYSLPSIERLEDIIRKENK